jgi:hypothetical protein
VRIIHQFFRNLVVVPRKNPLVTIDLFRDEKKEPGGTLIDAFLK